MKRTELKLPPEAFDRLRRVYADMEAQGYAPTQCAAAARAAIGYGVTKWPPDMEELVLVVVSDGSLRGEVWPFDPADYEQTEEKSAL